MENQEFTIATALNSPLKVPVQTSFIKLLLIAIPHGLAIVFVIFLVALPWYFILLIITAIALSLLYYTRLHFRQNLNKSVLSIYQDSAKNWTIITANTEEKKPVELQASSFISPLLLILNFKDLNNKTYSAIVVPDSLPAQDFRRLRVRIRVKGISK